MELNPATVEILDCFEEFLSLRRVEVRNPERDEMLRDMPEPEPTPIIYGSDYRALEQRISAILRKRFGCLPDGGPVNKAS